MARACRYLGWSRQAYYQDRQRQVERAEQTDAVVRQVREVRLRQPRIGTRKLHHLLHERWQAQGIALGRDALFGVPDERGYWCRPGGRTTRLPKAIIASADIPTCSSRDRCRCLVLI